VPYYDVISSKLLASVENFPSGNDKDDCGDK